MDEDKSVTATFDLEATPEFELEINTDGSGEGEVECKVGAGPTEPCEAEYAQGTEVTLVPVAETGSEFVKWSGDCTGTGSCKVTMNANKSVTATFDEEEPPTPEFTLGITKAGAGAGTVKCKVGGEPAEPCAAKYPEGTELELVATANAGSEFAGFSSGTGSAASCSTSPCSFTLEANSAVTATFSLIPRTLTISEAGTGTGTIKCKFNGGSAGACTSPQPNGTAVEVIATANAGSEFAGFSSGTGSAASCSTSPCSFTIEANSAVTATFSLIPRTLSVSTAGTGSGEVKCKFNGGSVGACTSPQPNGTAVEVIATANAAPNRRLQLGHRLGV